VNSKLPQPLYRLWIITSDWCDEPTGLYIGKVAVTRWNLIAALLALAFSAWFGLWYAGSWRTFTLLYGGYLLGGLWMFMRREQQGGDR
jgi:hypothetical protein